MVLTGSSSKPSKPALLNNREVRLTYLSGVMEIMSPIGGEHEYVKSTLGLLLEAYMREKGIRFYKLGGSPWKRRDMLLELPMSPTALARANKCQIL